VLYMAIAPRPPSSVIQSQRPIYSATVAAWRAGESWGEGPCTMGLIDRRGRTGAHAYCISRRAERSYR
jgi:hypothetical protein